MEKKNLRYSINASAISRYANRNFDLCLRHLPISSGQQFFLLRIYENEGIPLNKLAQLGFFDKGTVSRGLSDTPVPTDNNNHRPPVAVG